MIANAMANNQQKLTEEIDVMYGELRRIAAAQLRRERSDHTLSATALVNEAYLKLSSSHFEWNDKNHFRSRDAPNFGQSRICKSR
jgi:ECF sigma factor